MKQSVRQPRPTLTSNDGGNHGCGNVEHFTNFRQSTLTGHGAYRYDFVRRELAKRVLFAPVMCAMRELVAFILGRRFPRKVFRVHAPLAPIATKMGRMVFRSRGEPVGKCANVPACDIGHAVFAEPGIPIWVNRERPYETFIPGEVDHDIPDVTCAFPILGASAADKRVAVGLKLPVVPLAHAACTGRFGASINRALGRLVTTEGASQSWVPVPLETVVMLRAKASGYSLSFAPVHQTLNHFFPPSTKAVLLPI